MKFFAFVLLLGLVSVVKANEGPGHCLIAIDKQVLYKGACTYNLQKDLSFKMTSSKNGTFLYNEVVLVDVANIYSDEKELTIVSNGEKYKEVNYGKLRKSDLVQGCWLNKRATVCGMYIH